MGIQDRNQELVRSRFIVAKQLYLSTVEKWAKEPAENANGFTEQTRAIYASAAEEAEKEHIDGNAVQVCELVFAEKEDGAEHIISRIPFLVTYQYKESPYGKGEHDWFAIPKMYNVHSWEYGTPQIASPPLKKEQNSHADYLCSAVFTMHAVIRSVARSVAANSGIPYNAEITDGWLQDSGAAHEFIVRAKYLLHDWFEKQHKQSRSPIDQDTINQNAAFLMRSLAALTNSTDEGDEQK